MAVDALMAAIPDLGPTRACRRIGISRDAYYNAKRKAQKENPASIAPEPSETGHQSQLPKEPSHYDDSGRSDAAESGKAA